MTQLSPVPFHGDTIYCVEHDGQPYAPMKPIVENMGLAWQVQLRKLNENRKRWGITIMVIPSEGGKQEAVCLPVRKLPAWLASINPKKVRPELHAKIELYQAECDDALWNYWMYGKAERTQKCSKIQSLSDLYALRYSQYENLPKLEKQAISRRISKRLRNNFGYTSLARLPREKWQDAAILITAPMQRSGYGGLLKGSNNPYDSIRTRIGDNAGNIPGELSTGLAQLAGKLAKIAHDLSEAAVFTASLAKSCSQ